MHPHGPAKEGQDYTTIRRWTVDPSFYLQTVTADTGILIPPEVLDEIEMVVRASVPELSGGRFRALGFERGSAPGVPRQGWVYLQFMEGPLTMNALGLATVGGNAGFIEARFDPLLETAFRAEGIRCQAFVTGIIEHEIVHVMGFRHTTTLVDDFLTADCSGSGRSAAAVHHAAVAYARPRGNSDIDNDPVDFALTQDAGVSTPVVACPMRHWFQ